MAVTAVGYWGAYQPSQQLDGTYLSNGVNMHDGRGVHNGANNILWMDGHVNAWPNVKTLNAAPYSILSTNDKWSRGFDPWQP